MKQTTFASTRFESVTKRTSKREFLEEMNLVVTWAELTGLIQPFAPASKTGRPPFPVATTLRIHFIQQWFGLSDPALEEALHDMTLFREFALLDAGAARLPDESTILRFRHLIEGNNLATQILATVNAKLIERGLLLKAGTVVDAPLILAPSSTKNSSCEHDPEMHQTKKSKTVDALVDKLEKVKASIRAKVEHPFRVIKCQFGYCKTRYRGLIKNTAQPTTLFALSSLWMVRKRIIQGPTG